MKTKVKKTDRYAYIDKLPVEHDVDRYLIAPGSPVMKSIEQMAKDRESGLKKVENYYVKIAREVARDLRKAGFTVKINKSHVENNPMELRFYVKKSEALTAWGFRDRLSDEFQSSRLYRVDKEHTGRLSRNGYRTLCLNFDRRFKEGKRAYDAAYRATVNTSGQVFRRLNEHNYVVPHVSYWPTAYFDKTLPENVKRTALVFYRRRGDRYFLVVPRSKGVVTFRPDHHIKGLRRLTMSSYWKLLESDAK